MSSNKITFLPSEIVPLLNSIRGFSGKDLVMRNSECVTASFSKNGISFITGTSDSIAKISVDKPSYDQELEFTVNIAKFVSLLKLLPPTTLVSVSIDEDKGYVEIAAPKSSYRLLPHPSIEFADASINEDATEATFETKRLAEALSCSASFASTNSGLPLQYQNVHILHEEKESVKIQASDSAAFIRCTLSNTSSADPLGVITLRPRTAISLAQFLKTTEDDTASITRFDRQINLTCGGASVQFTATDAPQLKSQNLFDNAPANLAVLETHDFRVAASTLKHLDESKTPAVYIRLGEENTVSTRSKDGQEGVIPIYADHSYAKFRAVHINPSLLVPALNAIKQDEVGVGMPEREDGALWLKTKDSSVISVIQGIRM